MAINHHSELKSLKELLIDDRTQGSVGMPLEVVGGVRAVHPSTRNLKLVFVESITHLEEERSAPTSVLPEFLRQSSVAQKDIL